MVTQAELDKLRERARSEKATDVRQTEARQLTREIRERQFDRTGAGKFLRATKRFGRATGRGISRVGRATGRVLDKAEARRKVMSKKTIIKGKQPSIRDLF